MLRTLFIRTTRIRTTTPLISRRITRLIMTDSTAKMPSPPPAAGGAGEEPLSKSALKKLEKDKEKAKKKAEREAKELQEKQTREANQVDYAVQNYGNQTLNQSQERNNFSWAKIDQLTVDQVGERVRIQARVHNSRSQSAKLCFLVLRQQTSTIQTILSMTETTVSKQMIKYAIGIPLESIVIVEGIIQKPIEDIKTCTVSKLEIKLDKIFVLAEAPAKLPFLLEDASRPVDLLPKEGEQFVTVGTDTRLDNRVLDLRTPVNQAIFRVQSRVCNLFRIPQLAKQMAIAADFDRVYEIGPVFRAENSNTYRHMTEFIGLDLEMTIKEHYHETIDLLDGLFLHIFKGLQSNSTKEIQTIKSQFPLDDFKFLDKTLRLNHNDAIQILIDNGHDIQIGQDMGTEQERILGKLIKDKYQTDYYIIDKFPLAIRPFYTMPDPVDPTLSNSYDFFMRGEEIISGAQRIHEPNLLIERMKEAKIDPGEMKGYLDGFRLGCPAHAGGGIGLERVIMLFFGLGNIRRACLFPRDPKRLHP
ncbi:hypothetical protein H4Q26_013224 [Puccinia striiformis f. sp. tritici PST-130]|nr:hypothetical protein H4Q26_013224 [Puccinia striiformis f. sp. tritici PST-130]